MDWKTRLTAWRNMADLDAELKKELARAEESLEDHFYKNLEFGTGGMRGELGAGPNRMNRYTIRKAAEGLARYIESQGEEAKTRGAVIAYDSRHKSPEFALEAARTLGAHGIKAYVFESLRSTPELSFAVRHLNAFSGIVITASHNPPEYNGFKVYSEDGAQITGEAASAIVAAVDSVEDELRIAVADEKELREAGLLETIGAELDSAYQEALLSVTVDRDLIRKVAEDYTIVYTPLHGTGNVPVRKALRKAGFQNVHVVEEQELPDAEFPTVSYPNPEEHEAFELAIKYGEEFGADVLMGTDPDTDRVGVAARNADGQFEVLTGNQVGALLLDYLIRSKKEKDELSSNSVVMKTIVTSEIGRVIAESYGLEAIDTLTGFKYIGEKIREFEATGEKTFLFGYEESYGYLVKEFVRDKDAIQACLLAAEVGAYYKSRGMTLFDGLGELFERHGFFREGLESLTLKGKDGSERIRAILAGFRAAPPEAFGSVRVERAEDYMEGINGLPKADVLKYILADGSWVCLRPSGTEPKMKFYFGVKGDREEDSKEKLSSLKDAVMAQVEKAV